MIDNLSRKIPNGFKCEYIMIRTTITPHTQTIKLEVPKKYIGKKIEVLLYSVDELNEDESLKTDIQLSTKYRGKLSSEYANELRKHVEQSRNDWEERFPST